MQKFKLLMVMMLALSFSVVGSLSYARCGCKANHSAHGKNYTCNCKLAGKKCNCVHKSSHKGMHSAKQDRQPTSQEVSGEQQAEG